MAFEPTVADDAVLIARTDPTAPLGTYSRHPIVLDGYEWPSAEHYAQAMKFEPGTYFHRIREAPHPAIAAKLGNAWFRRRRRGWKAQRVTYMTRAIYTKCHAYPEVGEQLLATGERPIIECATYDYFWGCGRDGRGENQYGKLLTRVRDRLREEAANERS